jgi:hypothetical protein
MDPALRAALSRGFEDVGVPGEAGAEGGRLSAARCDQQYLDPGLRAAMGGGRAGGMAGGRQEGAEGVASAAQRGKRAFDASLVATLERGLALQAILTLAILTMEPR